MNEYVKRFAYAAAIRAAKTIAQTFVSMIGVATYMNDVNWQMVLSASILSGIMSLATSVILGLPEVE